MKTFACLALPAEHPFWRVEAAPLPQLESLHLGSHADVILQRTDGEAILYTPGQTQTHWMAQQEEKYSKFAYSSKYGFSVARSQKTLEESAPDSMLAFSLFGHIWVKGEVRCWKIENKTIFMEWSPVEGITIETCIRPTENGHIRTHRVASAYYCTAYDTGFAVPYEESSACLRNAGATNARAEWTDGFCAVSCHKGSGKGKILVAEPNTSMITPKTVIPMIEYTIPKGITELETEITFR